MFVFEFRDSAKKSVVEPLPQSRVRLLLLQSGSILRSFLLQQVSGWEAVPVNCVASHGERVGVRISQHILDKQLRHPQVALKFAQCDGYWRRIV